MIWTPRQRAVLIPLTFVLLLYLSFRAARRPAHLPNPLDADAPRAHELADRIDPNTADWPTLASLPQVGPGLAKRIIDERLRFQSQHPNTPPFQKPEDLLRVPGIGPAILNTLQPHLIFQRPPTTQP